MKTRQELEFIGKWTFLNENIIDKLPLNTNDTPTSFQAGKYVMPLPPLKKDGGFVPLLSLEYHPDGDFSLACLRLKVLMLQKAGNGLVGIGFRIESPESHCQDDGVGGIHDFYHAQLLKGIGYGPDFETPDWLPCSQPSFALWATDPIDAILNLVLTLYGREFYQEFITSITPKVNLSEEFKRLNERLISR